MIKRVRSPSRHRPTVRELELVMATVSKTEIFLQQQFAITGSKVNEGFEAFIQCGGFPGWRQWEARIEGACQKWMSGLIIAQHKWRARDRMWGWNQKEVSELKTLEWSTLGNKTNQALAQWWSWNCKVTVYSGCLQGLCLLWRGCQSWSERGVYEPRAKVFSEGKGATGD